MSLKPVPLVMIFSQLRRHVPELIRRRTNGCAWVLIPARRGITSTVLHSEMSSIVLPAGQHQLRLWSASLRLLRGNSVNSSRFYTLHCAPVEGLFSHPKN